MSGRRMSSRTWIARQSAFAGIAGWCQQGGKNASGACIHQVILPHEPGYLPEGKPDVSLRKGTQLVLSHRNDHVPVRLEQKPPAVLGLQFCIEDRFSGRGQE